MTIYFEEHDLQIQEEVWMAMRYLKKAVGLELGSQKGNWEVKFYPWYNGREKGFSAVLIHSFSECHYFTFANHRHSDESLILEEYVTLRAPINGVLEPGMRSELIGDEESERVYRERKSFSSEDNGSDLVQYVVKKMMEIMEQKEAVRILQK
jgi:hypothetical protein